MPLNPALRDPIASRRLGGAVLAVLVLWPLLHAAQVHPGALLDPANLRVIGGFLAGFLPPETGPEFRGYLARATLVASLHAVDLALACFPRIVGIRDGRIAFDLPAAQVDNALLHALYASEGEVLPTLGPPVAADSAALLSIAGCR